MQLHWITSSLPVKWYRPVWSNSDCIWHGGVVVGIVNWSVLKACHVIRLSYKWTKFWFFASPYPFWFILHGSKLDRIYFLSREKGRVLWQKPLQTHRKIQTATWQHKNATKTSITQRLRTDVGRSIGLSIATQLVW